MLDNGCVSLTFDLPKPLLTIAPWACSRIFYLMIFSFVQQYFEKCLEFKPKRNRFVKFKSAV